MSSVSFASPATHCLQRATSSPLSWALGRHERAIPLPRAIVESSSFCPIPADMRFRISPSVCRGSLRSHGPVDHRTYLGDVERDERNPSLRNIDRIAKALRVPAFELLK